MIAWIKKLFRREKVVASLEAKNERHTAIIASLRDKIERNEQKAAAMGLVTQHQAPPARLPPSPRPVVRHQALGAGYKPVARREGDVTRRTYEPTKDTSSDDIYLAMAATMLLADPPAPAPAPCSAPSFSSGGGGDYGGGGASGSLDSGSSDSSSGSSDSGSSSSSSD
jgi:hypothetical protein